MRIIFKNANYIIKAAVILLTVCVNFYIYNTAMNIKVSITLFVFSVFIFGEMVFYERILKNCMKDTFVELSDMLENVIDMRDEEVFSSIEDTLVSKLQHQTNKLIGILREKNRQIEKDRDEIKTLISDIAHQLKTPLTNLKMYGEISQDESLSEEERREFNQIIMLSINRLSFLIENMIKMSRLESGVIQLRLQENYLNDAVLLAISQVQKKAKDKNMEIELNEIDKVKVAHDKNWMCEAFFNVIENAIKYTGTNGIIRVTVQRYELFVRVDIEDNGIGIEEEELPKIFSRFYRGKNVGEAEGIGIGLYLTREIVSKHGGYMKVTSDSTGSTFSIFLPNNGKT